MNKGQSNCETEKNEKANRDLDDQQSESGENDSSLSPESPLTTTGRMPLKRKKKSTKKKK